MNKLFSKLPILPIIEVSSKLKCPTCTFLNNSSSLECSVCSNKLIKLCEECLVENKLNAEICISCKKPFVTTSTNKIVMLIHAKKYQFYIKKYHVVIK
jgi:hypothetical protein